jgi:hypothetical protein
LYGIQFIVYHKDSTRSEPEIEDILSELEVVFESRELRIYALTERINPIYISSCTGPKNRDHAQAAENASLRISANKVSSCMYVLRIDNFTEPFNVVLNNAFHDYWRAYVQEDTFVDKRGLFMALSSSFVKEHFVADGYANGWRVDPVKLDQNKDGKITLILYFWPHALFELGLIVSTLTACMVTLYAMLHTLRRGRS